MDWSVRKLRSAVQEYFALAETARPKTDRLYLLQASMVLGDISAQLRKWQDEARRRREADAPARALRLAPEVVAHWQKQLEKAIPLVQPGRTPCDYIPWVTALSKARGAVPPKGLEDDPYAHWNYNNDFKSFVEDIALPAWPDPRRDLMDFALLFLESDVMLFRSGYAKRHMIKRLQQAPLTQIDIARLDKMLRRSVLEGTGVEEYRAWCKLAACLVAKGHLGDLPAWLFPQAKGAFLNFSMADGRLAQQFWKADLSDADMMKLVGGVWRASRYAVSWPNFRTVIDTGGAIDSEEQRTKRNAWRMLDHIMRRTPSLERDITNMPSKTGEIFEDKSYF